MDAIILAGGLGTRLRSVVNEVPKCMAPVCEKPFLHYILAYLKKFKEIDRVVLSLGYKHELIVEWIEQQTEFLFQFQYSIEKEPLGTGGAIKKALSLVQSNEVIILNGDTFFDVDISLLIKSHRINNSLLSIALKPMMDFNRYGNVEIDNNNHIIAFKEKSYCERGQINGGIYIINSTNEMMDNLPEQFSFETEVLQRQINNRDIYGFIHNGYFIDIGIPEDYVVANKDFINLFL